MSFMFNLSEYQTCAERLELFWKDHPDGRIDTKLIDFNGGRYIVQAFIYRTEVDAHPWASGLAEETIQGRGVNATSALENCETSALARALANAGYSPKGDPSKRASREEMTKVATIKKTKAIIDETKAKMAQTSGEYIPVVKEDDPWTIKPATMPPTMGEAVATVKEIIGGQTEKDIPKCAHGDMMWKTGTSKAGKPWGHFKCKAAVTGEIGGRCESPNDVIWYEIAQDGSWQRQKARG
jgi:signal recognition particle subunit SEC65